MSFENWSISSESEDYCSDDEEIENDIKHGTRPKAGTEQPFIGSHIKIQKVQN